MGYALASPYGLSVRRFGGLIGKMNTIRVKMYCAVDIIACNLCGMKWSLKVICLNVGDGMDYDARI